MGFTNKIGGGKKNSTSKRRSVSKATQTHVLHNVLEAEASNNKNQDAALIARRLARKNARRTARNARRNARRTARNALLTARKAKTKSKYEDLMKELGPIGEAYEREQQEYANNYEQMKERMIEEYGPVKADELLKKLNKNMAQSRKNMLENNEFRSRRVANWKIKFRIQELAKKNQQERANYAAEVRRQTFGHGPIPTPTPELLAALERLEGHALAVQQHLAQQNGSATEEDEEERHARLNAEA
jgi:hypothetical protein